MEEEDRISAESRGPVTLQQDSVGRLSRMDAMQQQAMALASAKRREAEKGRIKAALKRVDEGEWGYCLTCGEEIAAARLENDPSVSQCIGCAGKAA
nr:TraR/DksA C4-type zinc finger protein [Pontixanthobacter sp. CEM42]